jgi:hypothetical protein
MKISQFSNPHGLLVLGVSLGLAACSTVEGPSRAMPGTQAGMTEASMSAESTPQRARYEVSFVPTWNPATHPVEYPFAHAKKGLLTPAIGATHNSGYAIFAPGTQPTPGLERLSEKGKHSPLDTEIQQAIKQGNAKSLIRFSQGSPGPVHRTIAATFDITEDSPLVSIVGMIAPSPDWFYGVSSVELWKDGRWVPTLAVPAYAWDSGGDGGTTYLAEDRDLNPKQATRMAETSHFVSDGRACPVGCFVFTRIPLTN